MNAHKLKLLQTERNEIEKRNQNYADDVLAMQRQIEVAKSELSKTEIAKRIEQYKETQVLLKRQISAGQDDIRRIDREMKSLNVDPVTEHALLRYIEHVLGIDLKMVREAILKGGPGFSVKRKDGFITTVVPDKPKKEYTILEDDL